MRIDLKKARLEKEYIPGLIIKVNDRMQQGYEYTLSAPLGEDFDPGFRPALSPAEMLKLGVFEGKYLNDCTSEFPREWFEDALEAGTLSLDKADISCNYFTLKSRQSLSVWRKKGWILPDDPDPRGWFQWYCRYYIGRRDPQSDARQIKRWRAFNRHAGQVYANCDAGDLFCRPRQRQALLQWAYNPFM